MSTDSESEHGTQPLYPFTQEELVAAMSEGYDELMQFVLTPEFKELHKELYQLSKEERPGFVRGVIMNEDELEKRDIVVPEELLIQRSSFGDRRPTLFCVKKYLPEKFHNAWENVNITFDNSHDREVPRDDRAWRRPLKIDVQSSAMENGVSLEELSAVSEDGFDPGIPYGSVREKPELDR